MEAFSLFDWEVLVCIASCCVLPVWIDRVGFGYKTPVREMEVVSNATASHKTACQGFISLVHGSKSYVDRKRRIKLFCYQRVFHFSASTNNLLCFFSGVVCFHASCRDLASCFYPFSFSLLLQHAGFVSRE